jgi:hypothetical protein
MVARLLVLHAVRTEESVFLAAFFKGRINHKLRKPTASDPGFMERAMGIEPTSEAWEAPVLPLNYARSMFLIVLRN